MPVMDEFKEEREALRQGTPRQKLEYFLDYYKWHAAGAVILIAVVASLIYQNVTRKETAFYAAFINTLEMVSSEGHVQRFAEYAGIDRGDYDLVFDASMHIDPESMDESTYASSQRLMVYIAAGELDAIVSTKSLIEQYAYSDSFRDIRSILTQEQAAKYGPYFFYMDQGLADRLDAARADADFDYSTLPAPPDPRKPEDMEKPVPVGIFLDNAGSLRETYYFAEGDAVLALSATGKHPEATAKYIDFLLGQ